MKGSLTFAFLAFCNLLAHAQDENYVPLNGPYGGGVDEIIPSEGRHIGIVSGLGIVISDDGGASWSVSNTGITDYYLYDLERDPGTGIIYALGSTRMFSTSDNGESWIVVATNSFSGARFIRRSPTGNLFIASSSGTIYRSTDGGSSWPASASSTLAGNPNVTDFEITATSHLFVATSNAGVFRSNSPNSTVGFTQYGATHGLTEPSCFSLTLSEDHVYVATYYGPFKSADNGVSWTSIKSNIPDPYFSYPEPIIEEKEGTVFLMNSALRKLWKSDNGGTDWAEVSYPMNNYGNENSAALSFLAESGSAWFASFQFGTFKSTDGGLNWIETNGGITGFGFYRDPIVVADNGRIFAAAGSDFGMFMSIDDGTTWEFLYTTPLDKRINGLKKVGTDIYAYGAGLLRTSDNGDSWAELYPESGSILGCGANFNLFACTDQSTFFTISTYNCSTQSSELNLMSSDNAGATWEAIPITGFPSGDYYIYDEKGLLTDNNGNGFVQVYDYANYVYRIYKINLTSGAAAEVVHPGTTNTAFEVHGNTLFVGADGNKLLTSEDGGLNWTTRSIPTSHGRLIAVNANTFYLLASDVYISSDGGDSWVNTGSLGYNRQATGVAISSANYAYLAMRDGPVQKSASPVIPPDPPSNLTIAGYSATLVSLKWDDNANNEQYHIIERSDGNNTSYDSVGYVNANSQSQIIGGFIVPNDNTLYYFRVRAVGPGGYSAYSNEVSVTTPLHCEVYTIPYNRSWTATTLDESGVGVFTNNEVPIIGANGSYQVRDLTVGATIGVTPPISEPVFVSFREDCGNVHMTSVFPLYANGNGTWDAGTETLTIHWQTRPGYTPRAETTVFTLNEVDPAPPAPLNLGAYIKTTEEIVVTWSGSNFAQQYQVQRSLTSGSGFVNVGEAISATSRLLFIDTETFSIGTTYYYRIVASSFGGGSTASDEIAVTVQTPLFEAISLPDFDYSSQGVAWVDIEGDGDDDLLVTPINVPSGSIAVFENNGDGTFDNIPVPGISDHEGFISLSSTTLRTISAGDVNNDGFMDFLALGPSTGGGIWINQSGTGFEYIELLPPDNSGQGWYAQLVDINNDGRLDAVVSQYSTPGTTATTHMRIFVQNPEGDFGLYELGEIAADATHSYGGNWADYDNDGDQDFFRSQYTNEADRLYRNNGDGTFSRLTGTAFETDGTLGSRSVSWGDFDNDLDLDVYVVNTRSLQYSMLYQNNGDGTFSRLPDNLLSQPQTVLGVGSAWGDVDNDGDLDMVLGNNQQSHLYLNDGAGNFSRQTGAEYLLAYDVSRANIAFALSDYDQNGSLDIAAGKNLFEFPSILLRNNLLPDANTQWLEVKLQGTASNRSGIGAHITIETPDGRRQMRAITSLTGYGSAGSLVAHFGLKDQSTVETLQVFWPSGATQTLTNISSNQILEIIEDGVGPKPAALYPLHEATAVRTGTFLEITLDESSIPVAGKFVKVVPASNPGTIVFSVDATSGTKSAEKYSFTLPEKLAVGTEYNVLVDEGAFEDIWENPSPAIELSDWSFTTDSGPLVNTYSPAPGATHISVNTSLQLVFDREITAVEGKMIQVMDGATTVMNAPVTSGVVNGTHFSIDPSADFPASALLTAHIEEGAFTDIEGNGFAGVAPGDWTFTTMETTAPALGVDATPLTLLDKGFAPLAFEVTATDNVEVSSVTFYHRKSTSKTFTAASMTPGPGTPERWTMQVTSAFADDMGFEFYVEAQDGVGNTARSPSDIGAYHQSRIHFTGSDNPVLSVPGEGSKLSWKIIAVPHDLGSSAPQVSQVFEEMGAASTTTWRMITYTNQPQEKWLEYPEFATIQRGKGYFINSKTGKEIALEDASSPAFSPNNLFELELSQGWNQIGNPYTVPVNWEDIRTFNEIEDIVGSLKLYTNGAYVNATELSSMQGGFVFAQSPVTVQVSFPGQTGAGGRITSHEPIGSDLTADRWIIPLKLSQGTLTNHFGGVGMHPRASASFDAFDDVNPPTFVDHLEMNFGHPEHFIKQFARDVVPVVNEHSWAFGVSASQDKEISLQWDHSGFGANARELYLVDENLQRIIDMRNEAEYRFHPGASSSFKIHFGNNVLNNIVPSGTALGNPHPNPSNGIVHIPYTIADQVISPHVRLEVYDLFGRKVATLVNSAGSPGYYKSLWDSVAAQVADGMYTVKLFVTSDKSREVRSEKVIINKGD